MVKINDRIIMIDVPLDDKSLAKGDYGKVINASDKNYILVKFKRALDPAGDEKTGEWQVEPHEIMVCEPNMTWKQIEVIADIVRGV